MAASRSTSTVVLAVVAAGFVVLSVSLALVLLATRKGAPPPPPVLVTVVVSSPGRSASELEDFVAEPLEDRLAGTPSLRSLTAWCTEGTVLLECAFDAASIPLEAAARVRDRVRAEHLPDDVETPLVGLATEKAELARYDLASDTSPLADLLTMHDAQLRGGLLSMPGVERVEVCGSGEPEVRVELDSRRLEVFGLRSDQVRGEVERWSMLSNPGAAKLEGLGELVVGSTQQRPIRLSDIADIRTSSAPHQCSCLVDGKPSLCASVFGRKEAAADVVARVRQWAASAPPGLRVRAEATNDSTVRFGLWASGDTALEAVPGTAKLVASTAQSLSDAACRVTLGSDLIRADGSSGELSFAMATVPPEDFDVRVKQAVESAIPGIRVAPIQRPAWEFVVRGPDLVRVAEELRKGVGAREGVFQAMLVGAGQRRSHEIQIKRERARDLGIMPQDVVLYARLAMYGELLGVPLPERPRIRLSLAGQNPSLEQLMEVHLPAATGGSVPLREIAEVRVETQDDPVVREDRERVVYVRVWGARGAPESWAEGFDEVASGIALPAGVTVSWRRVVER